MPLPPWPQLGEISDRAQSVLGGEVTLHHPPTSALWQVGFASQFELVIREDGQLHRGGRDPHCAPVLLWAHLRCAALNNALGSDLDLLLKAEPTISVVDVWDRRRGALCDHARTREVLSRARVEAPVVALLGEVRTLAELTTRTVALGAPGSLVELRREEGGVVVARAHLRVGSARTRELG
ncbi:MAG: hypothetical protein AB2A00_21320 [Myxococcota bacterium]